MVERRIIIRPEAFGHGFDIVVEPAPGWTSYDVERPTHRDAIRYAKSLQVVHGWKIVDQTGTEAG